MFPGEDKSAVEDLANSKLPAATPGPVLRSLSDYGSCARKSEEVSWDLDEAIRAIQLDFGKPFLPDALARTRSLTFLSDEERRRLNQVQAHAYAHLFEVVEDVIIDQILAQARDHVQSDRVALRALLRFCEEEVKHQQLFAAFKSRFSEHFPAPCLVVDNTAHLSETLAGTTDLAVMLMISMLEWITQKHYMSCFRECVEEVDASFTRLFELHWQEEAQHARLDSLEIDRIARAAKPAGITRGIDGFIGLCDALDEILREQAHLDTKTFEKLRSKPLEPAHRKAVLDTRLASYREMFIGCGLEHPVFRRIIEDLAPARLADIDTLLSRTL